MSAKLWVPARARRIGCEKSGPEATVREMETSLINQLHFYELNLLFFTFLEHISSYNPTISLIFSIFYSIHLVSERLEMRENLNILQCTVIVSDIRAIDVWRITITWVFEQAHCEVFKITSRYRNLYNYWNICAYIQFILDYIYQYIDAICIFYLFIYLSDLKWTLRVYRASTFRALYISFVIRYYCW